MKKMWTLERWICLQDRKLLIQLTPFRVVGAYSSRFHIYSAKIRKFTFTALFLWRVFWIELKFTNSWSRLFTTCMWLIFVKGEMFIRRQMLLYVWLYQPLYFQNWYLLTQQCSSPGAFISCQILYHLRWVRGQKYEMQENCVFNNCKCPAPCSSVMMAAPVGITWHGDGVIWLGRWSNMTKGTLFFLGLFWF